MPTSADALFKPFRLGSLELPNRIVMAPMTRCFSPNGVPGENVADYYRRRAESGVGLILSEGTVIDRPASRNDPNIPFFHGQVSLAGWKNVIDGVHAAGGKMGPQLWHVGAYGEESGWVPEGFSPESASGLNGPTHPRGVAMTLEDIADTISAFAKAASDAKRLGFDVAEIHGAHGYLVDNFFWAATNLRDDRYGGKTLPERTHFAAEIVAAMRAAVGPEFPILLRISQFKQQDYKAQLVNNPAEMEAWLSPLREAGVDIFHCSQRRFWEPEFPEIDGPDGLNLAGWAKKVTGAPTISVGSVGLSGEFIAAFGGETSKPTHLDGLLHRMERDEFDLIAVGRAILADPNWVRKVQQGAFDELQTFTPQNLTELY